jgi:pimeloyl-ACP methyl ester carboxylesterase
LNPETVILVHGLYMNGVDMGLLCKRLENAGFNTERFSYHSLKNTPPENALALQSFVETLSAPVMHFVCHSLGGLVIRHLFHLYPGQRPGRVVTLGTPHTGSSAALRLCESSLTRWTLGKSTRAGLLGDVPHWRNTRELGVIAGTLRLGFGMFIPGIPRPNDGTVAVAETMLDGMTDHITLPVSHFGMLLSKTVAGQTINFLRHGRFRH